MKQEKSTAATDKGAAANMALADGSMTCPTCGKSYADGSKYCPVDGAMLQSADASKENMQMSDKEKEVKAAVELSDKQKAIELADKLKALEVQLSGEKTARENAEAARDAESKKNSDFRRETKREKFEGEIDSRVAAGKATAFGKMLAMSLADKHFDAETRSIKLSDPQTKKDLELSDTEAILMLIDNSPGTIALGERVEVREGKVPTQSLKLSEQEGEIRKRQEEIMKADPSVSKLDARKKAISDLGITSARSGGK